MAQKISSPCFAGSHAVLELLGHFRNPQPQDNQLFYFLRYGFDNLNQTVEREKIDCSFHAGYEIKGKNERSLAKVIRNLAEKNIYQLEEIIPNTDTQVCALPDNPASARISKIGQVNVPRLLDDLVERIREMGGNVMTGVEYHSHNKCADGTLSCPDQRGRFPIHAQASYCYRG